MEKKKIILLGSTGSIGTQTLELLDNHSDFQVVGLAAYSSYTKLLSQVKSFQPSAIALIDPIAASKAACEVSDVTLLEGEQGLCELVSYEADIIIAAMSGTISLQAIIAAIKQGKTIAIANKELLVAAGEYIMDLAAKHNATLLPLDSEHSSLFQLLQNQPKEHIKKYILTASGGPFRNFTQEQLQKVSLKQALTHPRWVMGKKITIDSSTLMNKGLEIIEAKWLFNLSLEQLDVLIHPQSYVHAMVQFVDNSYSMLLSNTSMHHPISYALHYPKRKPHNLLQPLDFTQNMTLEFALPNKEQFKCLRLAYEALKIGKSMPCFMNAVNDVLVSQFLQSKIPWIDIGNKLEHFMQAHTPCVISSIQDIIEIDKEARALSSIG